MGLLGDIANQVLGKSSQSNLLNAVVDLLSSDQLGGLTGLVQRFTSNGLGDIINSWIGSGPNLPISASQLKRGLGEETVNDVAKKAGIAPEDAASQLAELLPSVIDKLTPDGVLPGGDILSRGMNLMKGVLR